MAEHPSGKIIRDGALVEDHWQRFTGEDIGEIPGENDVIVSLALWQSSRDQLLERNSKTAVVLEPGEEPENIADDLDKLPMVAIHFPAFTDGRGYSYARELRTRYGYKGEIRAMGDVLQDQLFYLHRVGFSAFDIRPDKDIDEAMNGLRDFSITYQGDANDPRPVYRRA